MENPKIKKNPTAEMPTNVSLLFEKFPILKMTS